MKCGLISRLKVGYIQERAKILQSVRVNDWFENEKERLGHLRDRASETGRRKEYPLDHFTRCDLPLLLTCLWCSSSLWLNYHFWILLFASSKINFSFVYNLLGNCVRVLLRTKLVEVSDTYWYPCVNL